MLLLFFCKLHRVFDIRQFIKKDTSARVQFLFVNTLEDTLKFSSWGCTQNRFICDRGYKTLTIGNLDTLQINWSRIPSTRTGNTVIMYNRFTNLRSTEELCLTIMVYD